MDVTSQVAAGVIVVVVLGNAAEFVLKRMQGTDPLKGPPGITNEKWLELTGGDEGGLVLGNIERLVYFGALWLGASALIVAWLAFKVASKWHAWTNVIAVPKSLPGVDEVEYLIARRRWGSQVLMTFLVGTLYNIFIAMLAYSARYL